MIIASESEGKVQIVVSVTADLTGRVKAGQIVKEIAPIVGGGGGGRPDFAEAGGKQPEKIDEMLKASEAVRFVQIRQLAPLLNTFVSKSYEIRGAEFQWILQ